MEVKDFTPSEKQREAINLCMDRKKRMVAITGPAGTGKTSIIKHIAEQCTNLGITFALAAPTGKAAKRITEATGFPAKTLHRLLEYSRPGERDEKTGLPNIESTPKRDWQNPLDEMMIIVDEYTMVNHELNRNVLDALDRGACIRMFGDVHQLPPVEKHRIKNLDLAPFANFLDKGKDFVILDEVYRHGEDSDIFIAANNIRRGVVPRRRADGNFMVEFTERPVQVLERLVCDALDNGVSYGDLSNQVLTPTNQRFIGTRQLNMMLRNIFNPNPVDEFNLPRHKWEHKEATFLRVGTDDKVVCTENTYDMRDYHDRYTEWTEEGNPLPHSFIPTPENKTMLNGETGKIIALHMDGAMEVDFGDRIVEVPAVYQEYWAEKGIIIDRYPGCSIDLAYAMTTHKAQGSEYKNVIYIMNKSIFFMLTRENFYTAITRARENATLITDQSAMNTALRNTEHSRRLAEKRKKDQKGTMVK